MNHTTDYLIRASLRSRINRCCEYVAERPRRTEIGPRLHLRVTSAELNLLIGEADGQSGSSDPSVSEAICSIISVFRDSVEVRRYTKDEHGVSTLNPDPIRGAVGLLHLAKTFGPQTWDERLVWMAPSFRKGRMPMEARETARKKIAHMQSPSATRVVAMKRSGVLAAIERLDGETIKTVAAALGEALQHHSARDADAKIAQAVANIENKSARLQAKAARSSKRMSERA